MKARWFVKYRQDAVHAAWFSELVEWKMYELLTTADRMPDRTELLNRALRDLGYPEDAESRAHYRLGRKLLRKAELVYSDGCGYEAMRQLEKDVPYSYSILIPIDAAGHKAWAALARRRV